MKHTFDSRIKRKSFKIDPNIKLNINYNSIDEKDLYGFYLTDNTYKSNNKELPMIGNFSTKYPDFFALNTEVGLYHISDKTCVCFYKDDNSFDTIDGLYNAIIYKDVKLLLYYKSRYNGVKYFVAPDYSIIKGMDESTIINQLRKSAIVFLWFVYELNAVVFTNITYGVECTFDYCFENIMEGSNVALSLKGSMKGLNNEIYRKAIKYFVKLKRPKTILIYSDSSEERTYKELKYALDNGVKILIMPNTLRERNTSKILYGKN